MLDSTVDSIKRHREDSSLQLKQDDSKVDAMKKNVGLCDKEKHSDDTANDCSMYLSKFESNGWPRLLPINCFTLYDKCTYMWWIPNQMNPPCQSLIFIMEIGLYKGHAQSCMLRSFFYLIYSILCW